MTSIPSTASVPQNGSSSKCPVCGSTLRVQWSWAGGRGERLVIRCTMDHAPVDGNGERWCAFGAPLEGHEALFAGGAQ